MTDIIKARLSAFQPSKNEKYNAGQLVIFFDNRMSRTSDDQFSSIQSYWTAGLYRLGWPSLYKPDLDPGSIRLVWYTVRTPGACAFRVALAYLYFILKR
jgi:hypothetical protein